MRLITLIFILFSVFLAHAQEQVDSLKAQIEQLSTVLEADSMKNAARFSRGRIYLQLGQLYKGMKDYQFLVDYDSSYFYAFHDRDNRLVYLDHPQTSVKDSTSAIILPPNVSHFFSVPAFDAVDEGDYNKALQLCEKALLLDSGNYDANEYRAYANFFLGNYEKCIPDFKRVLEEDSTDPFAIHNLASALSNSGNHEAAIPYYRYVLELDSNFRTIHFNLGNTYYYTAKYDSALYFLDKAVSMVPDNPNYINARGNTYLNTSSYKNALSDYRMARKLDSTDARYLGNMGLAYYHMEAYDKALDFLNSAIAMDSLTYYQFYDTRAHVYYELGQYVESNKDYFKSLELESPIQVYGNLGWNYYCMKDYDACIKYSQMAVEEDPMAWYAHYNIALAQLSLGHYQESMELYQALEQQSTESAQKAARKDLKALRKATESKMHKRKARIIMKKYL